MRALLEHKLRKGRHLGLDSSIIEATASLRELQHRNTKEDYWSYVKKLAAAAVINPVVHPAALAVHAQAHAITFEAFAPGSRRELTILIGVEDRRSPPPLSASRPGTLPGRRPVEGVGEFPGQHGPGIPIHYRYQIGEAFSNADVGDVGAPGFIRSAHSVGEKIRIDAMFLALARKTLAGAAVDGANPHEVHEPGDPRSARLDSVVAPEHIAVFTRTEGVILQVDLIDVPAELGILVGKLAGLGRQPVAVDGKELALAAWGTADPLANIGSPATGATRALRRFR